VQADQMLAPDEAQASGRRAIGARAAPASVDEQQQQGQALSQATEQRQSPASAAGAALSS
jgi:hypothetical protein